MIADTSAIEGVYTLAQTVLNVVMAVGIIKLKRRLDGIDFRTASTDNDVAGQHFRIAALEAAERARKELTK